jgi:hypothetical protein
MATRLLVLVLLVATACGKRAEGWACDHDSDCEKGLMCGTLQAADGSKQTMCTNPDGLWDMSKKPKTALGTYGLPVGIGAGFLVILMMLRSSIIAREKRKRANPSPPRA